MTEDLLTNEVGAYYEYALTKGNHPWHQWAQKRVLNKTGDVSNLGGAINTVFGAPVYDHINREYNAHAILKKENWDRSGFRFTTSDPGTPVTGGADPGTVTIVDASPSEQDSRPAMLHTAGDITLEAGFQATHDDGLDVYEWKYMIYQDIHANGLNQELLRDAETEAGALTANTSDAKNDANGQGLETLDRAIASDAEEDDVGGSYTGAYDIFGDGQASAWDRDSTTTFDSVVVRPDGSKGTFGTDLTFQIAGVDQVLNDTEDDDADPDSQVILTGRDTRQLLDDEFASQGRYDLTEVQAKIGFDGLTASATHDGRDISTTLRAYKGRPIVTDTNVPSDGSSRLYVIDQRKMHMKVGFPTLFFSIDDPAIRGQFDERFLYVSAEQLYNVDPGKHGKVRSIS